MGTTFTMGAALISGLNASQVVATDATKNFISKVNTGFGNVVFQTSPVLITPTIGNATATSLTTSSLNITSITSGILQGTSSGSIVSYTDNVIFNTVGAATVTGSVSFNQPYQTTLYKKVLVNYNNFYASYKNYTFPTAFSNIPVLLTNPLPTTLVVTSTLVSFTMGNNMLGAYNNTGITVGNFAGNTVASFLILEGY
jgi:phage-related minor tail protein